jgi:hypothetical protein
VATLQSYIKTRLSTPFSRNNKIEAEIVHDVTGQRKTAIVLLRLDDQVGQIMRLMIRPSTSTLSPLANDKVTNRNWFLLVRFTKRPKPVLFWASPELKLDRGKSQIHLHVVLVVAPTQMAVTAKLETLLNALCILKVNASPKFNRDLQFEIDFDGQKIYLTRSHSSGPAYVSLRVSLKTPFV